MSHPAADGFAAATLQRDGQRGSLLVPLVDRVVGPGADAIDVVPAADELVIVGELSVGELGAGELSDEDVRLELDPNAAEVDGTPLSPVGGLKLDPNPLGLDDIVGGSDVTLVLAVEAKLVDGEGLRRELPLLDGNCVLGTVGLDTPKLGMQGVSSG